MATQWTAGLSALTPLPAATLNTIGAAAESYTPTVTNLPTSSAVGRYIRVNNHVTVFVRLVASGAATGTISVSLPTNTNVESRQWNGAAGVVLATDVSVNVWQFGVIQIGTNTVSFSVLPGPAFYNATVPFTWANNDVLTFTITYLAA